MTWEGTCPQLKSVMLNSHYDVVPVFPVGNIKHCPMKHCGEKSSRRQVTLLSDSCLASVFCSGELALNHCIASDRKLG